MRQRHLGGFLLSDRSESSAGNSQMSLMARSLELLKSYAYMTRASVSLHMQCHTELLLIR